MSDFSDRLDEIRERRDKTYAAVDNNEHLYKSLPRLHRDCYWLLEVVDMFLDAQQCEIDLHEQVSACKMKHIMNSITKR